MNIIETFESFPKWAKVLLLVFVGIISALYRIIKYVETKNTKTLLVGVLCFIPCVGQVIQIVDIISELTDNKIKYFVD